MHVKVGRVSDPEADPLAAHSSRRGSFWDVMNGRVKAPPAAQLLGLELTATATAIIRRR